MKHAANATDSPATLVAIVYAAHRSGDRDLERAAKRRLDDEYGIRLRLRRHQPRREASHAS